MVVGYIKCLNQMKMFQYPYQFILFSTPRLPHIF